jgi:hypothetical protein
MSLSTKAYREDIRSEISSICSRVYDAQVPDNTTAPKRPYVVLYWIRPVRTGTDHHLHSSRPDTRRAGLIIQVTSDTPGSAAAVADAIDNALSGFRPTDCGEMIPEGRLPFSFSNSVPRPSTYTEELYFTFTTNHSWPD